ncbi:MAG: N-formylglutamate amidohydrolase [Coriobacteriia bacterium]
MPIVPATIVRSHLGPAPVIVHVPHAATGIPDGVRSQFLLDDEALQREIVRLTDWHTDHLFAWGLDIGATLFVNTHSRLVFDPERFRDDALEPPARYGQGVVYTHTSDGQLLANITPEERQARIENLYDPYHEALTGVVADTLERYRAAFILDCHSFPTVPLPTETATGSVRPDICIGTDDFHTPPVLAECLEQAFFAEGFTVHRNSPFAGTLVPTAYYHQDRRVKSVMIEVRRDLYCDEATGERNERWGRTRGLLEHCVSWALKETLAEMGRER